MSLKINSNSNVEADFKQIRGETVFKPVLSNTKSQNEAVFSNLSDIVNDKTPQKTLLHQLKESLASKPIDDNLKRKPATVIVNPKKSSDKMTADDYRQAVWQAVFKKAGYAMLTDGEIRQAVSLMKSVTSSITSSGLDLANMRRSDERLKTLTVKTDEFTIELAKRAGEAVWKGSQNEAEKAAQIKTGGKNEVNQITLDQGRIVWNSAVNTVEGTINTALDAALTNGGTNPLPLLNPNRAQVDFSSAKSDYQSQMMRRNLEGKLDGEGIKRGEATEIAVTILGPIVAGVASAPKPSPQSLKTLGGIPEVEATIAANRTTASMTPDKSRIPEGKPKVLDPNDVHPENIRGTIRENEAAKLLSEKGYKVEQLPDKVKGKIKGIKKPDFKIEGKVFDNFAPSKNTSARNIWSSLRDKIKNPNTGAKQAERFIINMNDSKVTFEEMTNQFKTFPLEDLKEIILIKDGKVIHFFPFDK